MDSGQENPSGSILDRVLQSQQTVALERFEPVEIVAEILEHVSQKEADVIRRRFGLASEQTETLESIGKNYHVTRERVRQIERWAIQHLRESSAVKALLRNLDRLLQQLLEEHGGILLEEDLFSHLMSHSSGGAQAHAAVQFLLDEMMTDKVVRVDEPEYKPYWKLRLSSTDLVQPTIQQAETFLASQGKPVSLEQIIEHLRQGEFGRSHTELNDQVVTTYLNVAKGIERNPFGEWGLREWGSVVPKRMNDKILLVLQKAGKPMHYLEITKRINEIGFDDRQAYPPTVHNELILSKEYVLVGRGIYALREWGYQPGVVADVLVSILKEAGQPLTRDELVERVLQQRIVKRNTIHLALTNKRRFHRLPDGRYALGESTDNTNTHGIHPQPA